VIAFIVLHCWVGRTDETADDNEGLMDSPRHKKTRRGLPQHIVSRRVRGVFLVWFFLVIGIFIAFAITLNDGFGSQAQASLSAFPGPFCLFFFFSCVSLPLV